MSPGIPALLEGFTVSTRGGSALPARVCAEHLVMLGARWVSAGRGALEPGLAGEVELRPGSRASSFRTDAIHCAIWWNPFSPDEGVSWNGSEALVQAVSGLMAVHGRDCAAPRRLGLEVASVAAGIVATQGILAALIGGNHGHAVRHLETSVLESALLLLSRHIAFATAPARATPEPPVAGPGPPFHTADGQWVEVEVPDRGAWNAFWNQLGIEHGDVEIAWPAFANRYLAPVCSLPRSMHRVMGLRSLTQIWRVATACGVGVCRVRTYPELINHLGEANGLGAPWTILPSVGAPGLSPACRPGRNAPLQHVRVVEASSRPWAGLLMRMLGAAVVKVRFPGGEAGGRSPRSAARPTVAPFACDRGKEIVRIGYRNSDGRAQFAELIRGTDVVLDDRPLRTAGELEFGPGIVLSENPGIVYAHAMTWERGSGESSPVAGDFLVQAHAACGDGLNPEDEPPFPSPFPVLDAIGGLLQCEGVLAGLYLRERSGRGCWVNTSLWASAMALQGYVLRAIALDQERGRRAGRPVWGSLDRPLETAGGWLVLELGDDNARRRLAQVCGKAFWVDDSTLAAVLRTRTAIEWEQRLREAGLPSAVVREDLATLAQDPRLMGLLEHVEDAGWTTAVPWRMWL